MFLLLHSQWGNMNRLLTEFAKAIQTHLFLFYKILAVSLMFVTVSVLLPFNVVTHSCTVCNVFVIFCVHTFGRGL